MNPDRVQERLLFPHAQGRRKTAPAKHNAASLLGTASAYSLAKPAGELASLYGGAGAMMAGRARDIALSDDDDDDAAFDAVQDMDDVPTTPPAAASTTDASSVCLWGDDVPDCLGQGDCRS